MAVIVLAGARTSARARRDRLSLASALIVRYKAGFSKGSIMIYPTVVATYAAILALIYVALSMFVILGRFSHDTMHGDGGDPGLQKRIRCHANFIEYVPLALILIGLYEVAGGSKLLVNILLALLVAARIVHPVGMFAAKNTLPQYALRGGGIVTTIAVIGVAAVALLVRVA